MRIAHLLPFLAASPAVLGGPVPESDNTQVLDSSDTTAATYFDGGSSDPIHHMQQKSSSDSLPPWPPWGHIPYKGKKDLKMLRYAVRAKATTLLQYARSLAESSLTDQYPLISGARLSPGRSHFLVRPALRRRRREGFAWQGERDSVGEVRTAQQRQDAIRGCDILGWAP